MPCCARKEKSPERHSPGSLLMQRQGPRPLKQTETGSPFLPQLSQAILTDIASSPKPQTETGHVNGIELQNYTTEVDSSQQLDSAGIMTQKEDQFQAKLQHWADQRKTKAAASSVSTTDSSDHRFADVVKQTESKCDDLDEWRQWADRRKAAVLSKPEVLKSRLIEVIKDDLDTCFAQKMNGVMTVLGASTRGHLDLKCSDNTGQPGQPAAKQQSERSDTQFGRLLEKYQKSILTGRKYGWTEAKCVQVGTHIESAVQAMSDREAQCYATKHVVAAIKAEQIEAHRRNTGLLKVEFHRLYKKFPSAMAMAKQSGWKLDKTVSVGKELEILISDLYASRGITPDHKEAADAIRCISEAHIARRGRQEAAAAQQAADGTGAAQKVSEDTEAAISAQECTPLEHAQLLQVKTRSSLECVLPEQHQLKQVKTMCCGCAALEQCDCLHGDGNTASLAAADVKTQSSACSFRTWACQLRSQKLLKSRIATAPKRLLPKDALLLGRGLSFVEAADKSEQFHAAMKRGVSFPAASA